MEDKITLNVYGVETEFSIVSYTENTNFSGLVKVYYGILVHTLSEKYGNGDCLFPYTTKLPTNEQEAVEMLRSQKMETGIELLSRKPLYLVKKQNY